MKFQNGTQIQDGRQFFFKFLQECLNLAHLLQKNFFFIKIQNGRKVQYMADFFCTKIHDFLVALNELF
jgi:hypothetical protein